MSSKQKALRDAAEAALIEMSWAVSDIAGQRLNTDEQVTYRSRRLAKAADKLSRALDSDGGGEE